MNFNFNTAVSDWINFSYFFIVLVISVLSADLIYKKLKLSDFYTRKFIHIFVGILIFLSTYILKSGFPILLLAFLVTIVNIYAIQSKKLVSIHGRDKSFGTVYYPLSVFFLVLFFWDQNIIIFKVSVLILSVSDALAALIGQKFGKKYYVLIADKKSIHGSVAMFLSSLLIILFSLLYYDSLSIIEILIISTSVALIVTVAELLSANGSDNLTVTFFASLFMYTFLNMDSMQLLTGILMSAMLALISIKLRFLNGSGSAAVFLMGSVIFGIGGWIYAIPILAFFISGSLLSKIGKKRKKEIESKYEKTGVRDYAQVLANGGFASFLVIFSLFSETENIYLLYLAVIAAATADTWATEIGIYSPNYPRLVTNFKKSEPGTSGAISLTGTMASFLGSLFIAFLGLSYFPDLLSIRNILLISIAGLFASFIDSFIGAKYQLQYKCVVCGKITEKKQHCNKFTTKFSGINWLNNDTVNIMAIFSALIFFMIFV